MVSAAGGGAIIGGRWEAILLFYSASTVLLAAFSNTGYTTMYQRAIYHTSCKPTIYQRLLRIYQRLSPIYRRNFKYIGDFKKAALLCATFLVYSHSSRKMPMRIES